MFSKMKKFLPLLLLITSLSWGEDIVYYCNTEYAKGISLDISNNTFKEVNYVKENFKFKISKIDNKKFIQFPNSGSNFFNNESLHMEITQEFGETMDIFSAHRIRWGNAGVTLNFVNGSFLLTENAPFGNQIIMIAANCDKF